MDYESAAKVIADIKDYIDWRDGCVALDGGFSLEQLEAIVFCMNHQYCPPTQWSK